MTSTMLMNSQILFNKSNFKYMHKRNGKGQSQVINSIEVHNRLCLDFGDTFILSLTGLWNTLHVPGVTHKWHILMSAVSPLLKTFTLPVEACKIISRWGN